MTRCTGPLAVRISSDTSFSPSYDKLTSRPYVHLDTSSTFPIAGSVNESSTHLPGPWSSCRAAIAAEEADGLAAELSMKLSVLVQRVEQVTARYGA